MEMTTADTIALSDYITERINQIQARKSLDDYTRQYLAGKVDAMKELAAYFNIKLEKI